MTSSYIILLLFQVQIHSTIIFISQNIAKTAIRCESCRQKMTGLSGREKRLMISVAIWVQCMSVTDRQTDGHQPRAIVPRLDSVARYKLKHSLDLGLIQTPHNAVICKTAFSLLTLKFKPTISLQLLWHRGCFRGIFK